MKNEERVFIIALLIIILLMTILSFHFSRGAKLLPLLSGIATSVMIIFLLLMACSSKIAAWYQKFESKTVSSTEVANGMGKKKEVSVVAWFSGCVVALYFLGYMIGITVFLFMFLKIWAKESWLLSLLSSVIVLGVVYFAFVYILRVPLHEGILFE
jgi:hypothetical protein